MMNDGWVELRLASIVQFYRAKLLGQGSLGRYFWYCTAMDPTLARYDTKIPKCPHLLTVLQFFHAPFRSPQDVHAYSERTHLVPLAPLAPLARTI